MKVMRIQLNKIILFYKMVAINNRYRLIRINHARVKWGVGELNSANYSQLRNILTDDKINSERESQIFDLLIYFNLLKKPMAEKISIFYERNPFDDVHPSNARWLCFIFYGLHFRFNSTPSFRFISSLFHES